MVLTGSAVVAGHLRVPGGAARARLERLCFLHYLDVSLNTTCTRSGSSEYNMAATDRSVLFTSMGEWLWVDLHAVFVTIPDHLNRIPVE